MFEAVEAFPVSRLWESKARDTQAGARARVHDHAHDHAHARQPPGTTPTSLKALVCPPGLLWGRILYKEAGKVWKTFHGEK